MLPPSVDNWIFRNIAGVEHTGAGFRHLVIHPQPDSSLQWADRSFETENGTVHIHWLKKDGHFTLTTEIPCNTDAEITLPDGSSYNVGSGHYEYTCAIQ